MISFILLFIKTIPNTNRNINPNWYLPIVFTEVSYYIHLLERI